MSIQLRIGPDAISSYKRLAYTPWHAIAEFVDNSTQSYFDHETELKASYAKKTGGLEVRIVYDRDSGKLRIADNAMGMTYSELEHALHVAKSLSENSSAKPREGTRPTGNFGNSHACRPGALTGRVFRQALSSL